MAADRAQPTHRDSVLDGAGSDPQRAKLVVRDDPGLALGKGRDGVVDNARVSSSLHIGP